MKRILAICAIASVISVTNVVSAAITTITFKGSDIVAPASMTVNTSGTPVIGDGSIDLTTGRVRTYSTSTATGDPAAFNAWLNSLGEEEGICEFNLWLQDGASNQAGMWGETIALSDAYSAAITPFASSGWTASVYTIGTEWGSAWQGRQLITFKADSAADYLRPGTTATFGFTADIIGYNGGTSPYQMWTGGSVVDSDVAADGIFQRAIVAVPEPATMVILGLGALLSRKFKRA